VVWDTSGSCFDTGSVTRFASELASVVELVRPSLVRVLYCDWGIQGEQAFEDGHFAIANVKPKGGGGTDLTLAFKYIAEKRYAPQACIVLSDGETPFGTAPPYPVLWCLTTRINAPYGRTIHVTT
jgi:predicted metal-dependent peptidase